jgi:hypothetical protein
MEQEAGQHRFVMPVSPGVLVTCMRCAYPLWPVKDWRAWEIAAERHLQRDTYETRYCVKHGAVVHSVRWRHSDTLGGFKQRVRCVPCRRGVDNSNITG